MPGGEDPLAFSRTRHNGAPLGCRSVIRRQQVVALAATEAAAAVRKTSGKGVKMQDQDVIREFLGESHENLSRLDQDLVELEKRPKDSALLASIFRTFHTIKGTCGFLGFSILERTTHHAETLLSQLRDGQRELSLSMVSLILETVDATRKVLAVIEATGEEGTEQFEGLTARLCAAAEFRTPPLQSEARQQSEAGETETSRSVEETCKTAAVADTNIRVAVGLLDKLMDLVGELVLTRNQILQFNAEREDAVLNATSQRLNLITGELQEGVMKTRMQPIGVVWNKLPRVVRDMSVTLGKQLRLEMDGAETELDRTIIEAIKDPLVHLVRNSCDHGVELPEARLRAGKPAQGTLTLRAYHEGGQVNIEIGDDGAGIDVAQVKEIAIAKGLLRPEQAGKLSDREALNLIFQPGFSTAAAVTNVSGRGVGMDVVKSHIEKIGGVVDIVSRPGAGTTVKIKIPLTLAIIPGLVIASGGERFVIPQVSLLELIRLEGDTRDKRIEHVHGTPVYRRRGSLLPIAYLNQVLGLPATAGSEVVNMVILQADNRQFGLVVDGINDTQEIVVKPLGKQLKSVAEYAGATIMGDGKVALILDVLGIGQSSGVMAESRERTRTVSEQKDQGSGERQRLLLFRSGSFERLAVPLSLVARLEEFPLSSIEHAGRGLVVQYRERILPLIPLRSALGCAGSEPDCSPDPVQVVVFNDGDRGVGLVVDQILDVAEEVVTVRQKSACRGILGSAVVGKRVTDFLDLNYVLHLDADRWMGSDGTVDSGKRVLVTEPSTFSRGLIRNDLNMAGYRVTEAGGPEEAVRGLEQQTVDVVVAAADLRADGASPLISAMRRHAAWGAIPVLALTDPSRRTGEAALLSAGFADCQSRFDREAMLRSLAQLAGRLTPDGAIPEHSAEGKRRWRI